MHLGPDGHRFRLICADGLCLAWIMVLKGRGVVPGGCRKNLLGSLSLVGRVSALKAELHAAPPNDHIHPISEEFSEARGWRRWRVSTARWPSTSR